jgi:hypothetical protein
MLSNLTVINLSDSGPGSLRYELAQARGGDTIVFARDLQGTITLTSGELQVGQNATIQGPGANVLSVSGNHAARVFEVLAGIDATISGLTIRDGLGDNPGGAAQAGDGGGVYVDSGATLRLLDSVVRGNVANDAITMVFSIAEALGCGGGIYNAGTLTLTGDTVAGNVANSRTASAVESIVKGIGGGVYNAGTLTAEHSVLSGNVANSGHSRASVPNGADARGIGGGVYNAGALTLSDTTVDHNTANTGSSTAFAGGFGGGISSDGTGLNLLRVTLVGDIANSGSAIDGSDLDVGAGGGGLEVDNGTLTVTDCTFSRDIANAASVVATGPANSAARAAGYGGAIDTYVPLTATNSVFTANLSNTGSASAPGTANVDGEGGAIYGPSIYNTLTINGCVFRDNTANAGPATAPAGFGVVLALGGGIYTNGNLTIRGGTFTGNVANSADASSEIHAFGGAIENEGPEFLGAGVTRLAGSTLANNVANTGSTPGQIFASGGALDSPAATITRSSLIDNAVNAGSASAVYAEGGGMRVGDGTVRGSLVANNVVNAASGIGAFYLAGGGIDVLGHLTLRGSFVLDNNVNTGAGTGRAAKDSYAVGGGIAVEDGAVLTLDATAVTGNLRGHTPSDITVLPGGKVNNASADNLIGPGGSGGLVNGVNGNAVG